MSDNTLCIDVIEQPFEIGLHAFHITLNQRQLCDLELLLNGGFTPLTGFMTRADYESVLKNMGLANGSLWPMPITLDMTQKQATSVQVGQSVVLCDLEGTALAVLTVTDKWHPDKTQEAHCVFGTMDTAHPGVHYLLHQAGDVYIGGSLKAICAPKHYDFNQLRLTPAQLKQRFAQLGWTRIVAFQTRNPMHRAHVELTRMAMQDENANCLIHPSVGMTKPGDVDYFTRIRCYEKALTAYPENSAILSLLPLAMRMGGPREALWHAIIRKNYGCTHFIVGRDHAGPGNDSNGKPFYDPYAAQELVAKHQSEIGIKMVPFHEVVYDKKKQIYIRGDQVKNPADIDQISGTQFRAMLRDGMDIPEWFSYPAVVAELRKVYPPKVQQGFTLFFTGLSGAGKSTIANALIQRLHECCPGRAITLLDGDLVRQHLSSGLGFSKEDRDLNIRRIGYVASEITKHKGIAICALIAPYAATREEVKKMITALGGFFEIYVSTSISICRKRDPKGLYKKVDAGIIQHFTGVDDPYETPVKPDIEIDTVQYTVAQAVEKIAQVLINTGYLQPC